MVYGIVHTMCLFSCLLLYLFGYLLFSLTLSGGCYCLCLGALCVAGVLFGLDGVNVGCLFLVGVCFCVELLSCCLC